MKTEYLNYKTGGGAYNFFSFNCKVEPWKESTTLTWFSKFSFNGFKFKINDKTR